MNEFKYNGGELEYRPKTKTWIHSGTDGGGHGAWGQEFKDSWDLIKDIDKTIKDYEERYIENMKHLKELRESIKTISYENGEYPKKNNFKY